MSDSVIPIKPQKDELQPHHVDHHIRLHERVFEGKGLIIGRNISVSTNDKGQYILEAAPAATGVDAIRFANPIELPVAPYPAYSKGEVIHIQPTHVIVTTGIRDAAAPSAGLVRSCAGFWIAKQPVPGQTTVSGNPVWNLPQFPLPDPTNLDGAGNYWTYWGEMAP